MTRAKKSYQDVPNPFANLPNLEGTTERSSLTEARAALYERFRGGLASTCPCCGRFIKCHSRPISASMVRSLRILAGHNGSVASHVILGATHAGGGGVHAVLAHWGLAESVEHNAWRITNLGRAFLRGEVTVPRFVYLYNKDVLAMSVEHVNVHGVEKRAFDLDEMLDPETGANKEIL